MRIFSFVKFYLIAVSFLFVVFSIFDIGLRREVFLFLAVTFMSPMLFKGTIRFRGVSSGDLVLVSTRRDGAFGSFVEKMPAKALSNGKIGDAIEIQYGDTIASGEILNYGGLFFPPEVGLLYYEKPVKGWRDEVF